MLDVFKSKMMVIFMLMVLGVVFVDCSFRTTMEDNDSDTLIVLNS